MTKGTVFSLCSNLTKTLEIIEEMASGVFCFDTMNCYVIFDTVPRLP